VAGAAVDLTLRGDDGTELPMGCAVNATPEESSGRCYTDSVDVDPLARQHRNLLGTALRAVHLVNYPSEWWHWSYGDRYWAFISNAVAARYGPIARL
jgi:D-alanyl-D-alanine dipeptidase